MGFFDFLGQTTRYRHRQGGLRRLNLRHEFLITPYLKDIAGARVLDLASQDGRWAYALAEAGAREVVGIEARPELVRQYDEYPESPVKERTRLVVADIFEELPRMVSAGETFDVVAIYGLYYHIMDHYRLLQHVTRMKPSLVVIDSEFATAKRALIEVFVEPTTFPNSIAHVEGQQAAPIGVPSRAAVETMAGSLGYTVEWADWTLVPQQDRKAVSDYYRDPARHRQQRGTCALRPIS